MKEMAGILLPLLLATALFLAAGIPRERRRDRLIVGAAALLFRAGFAAVIFIGLAQSNQRWVFPDEQLYFQVAQFVQAGGEAPLYDYTYLLAALFDLTGPNEWVIRATNVVLGAGLAIVVYELVHLLVGRRPAFIAGLTIALWPSLILWSSLALKDSLILFALAVFFLGATHAWRGSFWGVIVAIAGIALVDWMRPWAFVVASAALVIGLIIRMVSGSRRAIVSFAALVALTGVVGIVGGQGFLGANFIISQGSLGAIRHSRVGSATGETAFTDAPGSIVDVLGDLPSGVLHGLLGPFPWTAESTRAAAFLVVELAFWWTILLLAVVSFWRLRPRGLLDAWAPLVAFAAGVVLVVAVYESNAGTALRQRAMIFPIVSALAAVTLSGLRERRSAMATAK